MSSVLKFQLSCEILVYHSVIDLPNRSWIKRWIVSLAALSVELSFRKNSSDLEILIVIVEEEDGGSLLCDLLTLTTVVSKITALFTYSFFIAS